MAEAKVRNVVVNFEGVETGGGSIHVPEGDYGLQVTKVIHKVSEQGKPNLKFTFKIIKGNPAGLNKSIMHNCSLQKQSLWNLRNLIESAGKAVPSKAIKLDLDRMVGWQLAGTLVDGEYNGKKKSEISAFFPMADLAPAAKKEEEEEETTEAETETAEDGEGDEAEELFE